jgi:hypothetical protein
MVCLLVVFSFSATCSGNSGKILTRSDFTIIHQPTGQTVVVGKQLLNQADWPAEDLKMSYEQLRVVAVTMYSENFITDRGVKVSDSIARIKEIYGQPYDAGERSRYNWVTYLFENLESSFKIHFYFDKDNDRVIAINLNLYPVGSPPLINVDKIKAELDLKL